jgi:hypothetical protein
MKVFVLVGAILAFATTTSFARGGGHGGHGGRVSYGGGHHTVSHGGTYVGSSGGSSHRGGHYSNPATGNAYGTHQ